MAPTQVIAAALSVLLLAGCASRPQFTGTCPPSVPVPAGIGRHPTAKQVGELEVRVELAREAERQRGDECAAALEEAKRLLNK